MNPSLRATVWDLAGRQHDLLVIGGGITGAGIAREAALAGLSVALVERADFAAGTSSASSRLIHGGLRYLEQRAWRLVREALRERRVLLDLAPHLVRPLEFLLPTFKGDRNPRWKIAAGLFLYDVLALRGNVRRHRILSKRAALDLEPLLRERGLTGAALYWDAQCDDARLTLATIRAAHGAGAVVANHMEVLELLVVGGRVTGAMVRDNLTGATGSIQARVVVNATGPWCDALRRLEDPTATPLLRPTRGAHIMVSRAELGHHYAITFMSPVDGRVMFVLPWGERSYIGTTDVDQTGSVDHPTISADETLYLIRSVNALFPTAHLAPENILGSWAGIRPLVATDDARATSSVPREHRIVVGPGGMVSVAGGKLTTFRQMAIDTYRSVAAGLRRQGRTVPKPSKRSATERLPGGGTTNLARLLETGEAVGLQETTVMHLVELYGSETPGIVELVRRDPSLGQPLHSHHPAVRAEVVHAVQVEAAVRLDDLLTRRLHLRLETADGGAEAVAPAAAAMAELLNWSSERQAEEEARYLAGGSEPPS